MPFHNKADAPELLQQRSLRRLQNPITLFNKISAFALNDHIRNHTAPLDAFAFGVGESDFAECEFATAR